MTRYLVIAGLFVLSLITYIDRAAISSARDAISGELALSNQQFGAVMSAFALGYALAQVPSGWLADRTGPRLMLAAVVTLWSLLTAATGFVATFATMLVVRFAFGVAEAGAFPGAARAFYNWLPPSEHGRANGIIFSGSRLGAAIAFPLMAWLLGNWNWRASFYLLALPGLLWAAAWFALFRDQPAIAPKRPAEEPSKGLSFAQVIASRPLVLAMLQYFATNFVTFLCLSWMLPYLKDRYQLSNAGAAFYAMIPLLVGATAQWATGFFVDRLYLSTRRQWSRALPAMLGFALSAVGLTLIPAAPDPAIAAAFFAIAAFGAEMTISPSWAFCMDVGGKRSGAVTGAMNMAGNIGSFVSANAFPFMQSLTGSASAYFYMVAFMCVGSICCWLGMKRSTLSRGSL